MSPVNGSVIELFRAAPDFSDLIARGYFAFSYG